MERSIGPGIRREDLKVAESLQKGALTNVDVDGGIFCAADFPIAPVAGSARPLEVLSEQMIVAAHVHALGALAAGETACVEGDAPLIRQRCVRYRSGTYAQLG